MFNIHIPFPHLMAYGALSLAQIAIAVNIVAGKYVIEQMPTFIFLGLRFLISSVILTIIHLISKQRLLSSKHDHGRLTRTDLGFLFAQALTGGFLFNYFFFWGMEYTTAMAAGIISSTLPAIIAICAYLFLGERLTQLKIVAIILAMIGIVIVSIDGVEYRNVSAFRNYFGDMLIFIAMIPEALYSIFNKYSNKRFTPLGSAMMVNWMICFMMLPLGYFEFQHYHAPDALVFWNLIFLCALTGVVFYWAWPKGLQVVPANTAAVFGGLVPVITTVLSWAFLKEMFGWHEAIGMCFVFAALLLGIDWHHKTKQPAKASH